MYFFLPDKIIAATPRVASRSIRAAVNGAQEYSRGANNLKFDSRPVILFVRDPMEKFESGYRLLLYGGDILVTYEGLVNAVLDVGFNDMHLTQQAEYHAALFADDFPGEVRLYPFERIGELWPKVVGGEIGKIGSNEGPPKSQYDYRRDELMALYAADYELRGRCDH